jgi:hypothetical protein
MNVCEYVSKGDTGIEMARITVDDFEVINESEHDEPWGKRTPLEAVADLIGFLRCYIRPERQQYCVTRLNELVNSKQFKKLDKVNDDDRDLFKAVVAATMNCSNMASARGEGIISLSHTQIVTLYNKILIPDTKLPFCVRYQGVAHSWFVPEDKEKTRYKSCLWVDESLAKRFLASQAVYSDTWVPFVDPSLRGGPPPNIHAKVDMIVWFVWFILNKSGRAVNHWDGENKVIMNKSAFNEVLDRLVSIVQEMSEQYAFLGGQPGIPNPLLDDYFM